MSTNIGVPPFLASTPFLHTCPGKFIGLEKILVGVQEEKGEMQEKKSRKMTNAGAASIGMEAQGDL